jgi:hypothetical protein
MYTYTARSKSIPLLCTHVDSYKLSTVHPPRITLCTSARCQQVCVFCFLNGCYGNDPWIKGQSFQNPLIILPSSLSYFKLWTKGWFSCCLSHPLLWNLYTCILQSPHCTWRWHMVYVVICFLHEFYFSIEVDQVLMCILCFSFPIMALRLSFCRMLVFMHNRRIAIQGPIPAPTYVTVEFLTWRGINCLTPL